MWLVSEVEIAQACTDHPRARIAVGTDRDSFLEWGPA